MDKRIRVFMKLIVSLLLVTTLWGCETIRGLLNVQRPTVTVERSSITEISFDGVEITAELAVGNPNPLGISLSGFSYQFDIEGDRFLSGDVSEPIQIEPRATSPVSVPVAFEFSELLSTARALQDAEEAAFSFEFQFRFTVPILGELTVPARVEGTFPVVRVPRIRVASLKLESLTIAGADLNLAIAVDNPNSFGLTIDQFEYSLEIANQPWSTGQAPRRQTVPPGSSSVLTLPFTVRFASVGRSVRDVLRGQAPLQYSLAVQAGIVTDLAILPRLDLPLDLAGTVDLSR